MREDNDEAVGWSVFTEEAQAEIEDLRAEITRLRLERADLRRALVATRRWAGIQPANANEMRALLEARDDGAEALDYQPRAVVDDDA
jgi:hypothetical protein